MKRRFAGALVVSSLVLAGLSPADTYGALERVGPVNPAPAVGSFPAWYQDRTGLTLEFCDPRNQAEVDGGWCLLLPGDVTIPEVFPTNFFDEHFYFAADATINTATGGKALLVLALESAFAVGPAIPGDQIVFARIRVRLNNAPVSGNYRFIHPYGEENITATAGERIFFTDDAGINCAPGTFDCALGSRLGPFLLPSDAPGGPELPAVAGPAGLYIADPGRLGPVTGGLPGQNVFRIEGPPGSNLGGPGIDFVETFDFALMGRIFTQAIPGRVTIDRASFARDAAGERLDVFATAFPTTQGRVPPNPQPAAVTPVLAFLAAPCGGAFDADGNPLPPPYTAPPAGTLEAQMFNSGSDYWGQMPLPTPIPTHVCVEDYTARDANGQVVPTFFNAKVTDLVLGPNPQPAFYDPANGGSLTVTAGSSDGVGAPVLSLAGFGDLTGGQIVVTPLAAPPAKVRVNSSLGGSTEFQVVTGVAAAAPPSATVPVAGNDEVSMLEDGPALVIPVLANDTLGGNPVPAGATVTITGAPRLGSATVNADGTITYTPFLNANGTEGIAYTVTVDGATSPAAYVTIIITPVNDAPVAVTDAVNALVGTSTFNVLANDTDVDGQADLATAANITFLTGPATPTITAGANGAVSFTTNTAGIYSFSYQAQDQGGLTSAAATVTVNVAGSETVTIQQATFRTTARRWIVSGTDSIRAGQTLTIRYDNGSAAGTAIGSAVVDATGAWNFDVRGVSGILDPRTTGATRIRITSSLSGDSVTLRTATINIRS
jgi:hypothetical protein